MTTHILSLSEIAVDQASKYATHNKALHDIEGQTIRALSRSNGGPPGSPSNGDVYIVDSATSGWSTFSVNDIAHYYGGSWKNYTPVEGQRLWLNDEDILVIYDGSSWITFSLNILADIDFGTPSTPADEDILIYEAATGTWRARANSLGNLTDVDLVSPAAPTDGQILKYDANSGEWYPDDESAVASSNLSALNDVDLTSPSAPTDFDVLTYDAASGDWYARSVPRNIGELGDVDLSSPAAPTDGQILKYDAPTGEWYPDDESAVAASSLASLTDVDLTSPAAPSDGDVLTYDAPSGEWYAEQPTTGVDNLGALTDVDLTSPRSPNHGDVLIYDSNTGEWYPADSISMTVVSFEEVDNGNSGASATIDWTAGQKQKITLNDSPTLSFTDIVGAANFVLKVVQDGTGSRTITWPANVKWPGGTAPTLTTTADAVDLISFYFDGVDYYGQAALDFS